MLNVKGRDIAALLHEPPIIAVSVAPSRYSHSLLLENKEFVLNIVGQSFLKAVETCGSCSGKSTNKFAKAGLRTTCCSRAEA